MKLIRVTYFALASVSVASCTKEASESDVYDWENEEIYFKTFLCDVGSSRSQDMTLDHLESFQVTCFNTADREKDPAGYIAPYFENATFVRQAHSGGATYVASPQEEPRQWPPNAGLLRFFTFSPSLSVMADGNSALEDTDRNEYFNLINTTTETQSTVSLGYRLGRVRINPDISRQFDFITAEASGERWKDFTAGVELAFTHQLCQVELRAWGADSDYDFEIAGVRLGNPVVEGTFVFADDSTPANAGAWDIPENAVTDKVEYIYRGAGNSGAEEKPADGDRLYRINAGEHNTPESAASITGRGGYAMVIPTVNTSWEGLDDPNIGTIPYTTDKMYFSILMRVTEPTAGSVVYPYPGNPNGMNVVSYAVDNAGNIIARLYAGKKEGTYFFDPELMQPYAAAEGVEIKDFGWAAVPVDADWSAGKKYVYTLNYSEGIGVHDPADPEPGKLIVGNTLIEWGVSVGDWEYAEKDENYDPDLDVP